MLGEVGRREHLTLRSISPRDAKVLIAPAAIRYDGWLMETVTLTIDGRQVTVEKGKTVLQAAIEAGVKIPYYCYHPALGIDGSCRVCIVKIEKMPKLQTSCSTPVADGMVVSTQTPDVVEARASVFEFLLINHPLDCPVCDKGGECPLQDFSYSFGPNESRMEFSRRVFDGEGCAGRRRLRSDADAQPQPLHPLHALRAVHARDRRRRADQHRRSRLRQRDRHVPRRGRALAALGQPDGRLPGRRDHDARLPVQVAALGQPGGGRHDLHALREGLQHHRLDQGQARVGEGRAPRPDDAALQPGRQRLLDVRHRPVRLSLGRRRRSAAAAAGPQRAPARSSRPTGPTRWPSWPTGSRRPAVPAGAALPALGARVARGAVRRRAARRRVRRAGGRRGGRAGASAASRSPPGRSSGFRRSMRRTCQGARDLGFPVTATPSGEADLVGVPRGRASPARLSALYVFDPGAGRVDRRRLLGDRRAASRVRSRRSSCTAC